MADDQQSNQAATPETAKEGELKPDDGLIAVKIYSPFKVYFEGPAKSVSAASATGPFDILPKHHNFITILDPCTVVVRQANGEPESFTIQGGVMHVKADELVIFLDV